MDTAGLEDLTGSLFRWCGDIARGHQQLEHCTNIYMTINHSSQFKEALKRYVAYYNQDRGTKITISFPKPNVIRLRAAQKSPPKAPSDPAPKDEA